MTVAVRGWDGMEMRREEIFISLYVTTRWMR